jgi:hypothetical protein
VTELNQIFQRPEGEGWLILSDWLPELGGDHPELLERLLGAADISYPSLCISASEGSQLHEKDFIEDIDALFGQETMVVGLTEIYEEAIGRAGMLFLTGGTPQIWTSCLHDSALESSILEMLSEGTLVFASDAAAAALGEWALGSEKGEVIPGLKWLPGILIVPWYNEPEDAGPVLELMGGDLPVISLGISGGRILALGPEDQIQSWGSEMPSIVFNSAWQNKFA